MSFDYIYNEGEEIESLFEIQPEDTGQKIAGNLNLTREEAEIQSLFTGQDPRETNVPIEPPEPGTTIPKHWQGMYTAAMKASEKYDPAIETDPEQFAKSVALFNASFIEATADYVIDAPDNIYNGVINAVNSVVPEIIPEEYKAHTFTVLSNLLRTEGKNIRETFAPEGANTIMKKVFAGLGHAVPDIAMASVSGLGVARVLAKYDKIPTAIAHVMGTAGYGYATGGYEKGTAFAALDAFNIPFRGYSKAVQVVAGATVFGTYDRLTRNVRDPGYDPKEAEENTIAAAIMGGLFPLFGAGGQRRLAQDMRAPFAMAKNWIKSQKAMARDATPIAYLDEVIGMSNAHEAGQSAFYGIKEFDSIAEMQTWISRDIGEPVTATGSKLAEMIGTKIKRGPNGNELTELQALAIGESLVESGMIANELTAHMQNGLKASEIGKPLVEGEPMATVIIKGEPHSVRVEEAKLHEIVKKKQDQVTREEEIKLEKTKKDIVSLVKEGLTVAYETTAAPEFRLENALKKIKDPAIIYDVMESYHTQYAAPSLARLKINDLYKEMNYEVLSEGVRKDLDIALSAQRDIGIGKRHGEKFMWNERYPMNESIIRFDRIERAYKAGNQELTWEQFKDLMDIYQKHITEPLREGHREGIFSDQQLEAMIDLSYVTSKTMKEIDAELQAQKSGVFKKDITKSKDLPFLDQNKGAIKNENTMLLAERHINIMYTKIAQDRFKRKLNEVAQKFPTNPIAQEAKFKYTEIGFEGKETEVFKKEWEANEKFKAKIKQEKKLKKEFEKELDAGADELYDRLRKEIIEDRVPVNPVAYEPKNAPPFLREIFAESEIYLVDPITMERLANKPDVGGQFYRKLDLTVITEGKPVPMSDAVLHELLHRADLYKGMGLSKTTEWKSIYEVMEKNIREDVKAGDKTLEAILEGPHEGLAYVLEMFYGSNREVARQGFPKKVQDFVASLEELNLNTPKFHTGTMNILLAENGKLQRMFEKTEKLIKKYSKQLDKQQKIKTGDEYEITSQKLADRLTSRQGKNKSGDYKYTKEMERLKADNASFRKNVKIAREIAFDLKVALRGKNIKKSARPIVPEGWKAHEFTENGEKKFVLISEEYNTALEAVGGRSRTQAEKFGRGMLRWSLGVPLMKACAVTYNPLFGAATAPRDVVFFYSSDPAVRAFKNYLPKAVMRSPGNFIDVMTNGPKFRAYGENGGLTGEAALMSAVLATSKSSNILGSQHKLTPAQTKFRKFKQVWTAINSAAEITNRITHEEYLTKDLGWESKKATRHVNQLLNFNRKGQLMEWLDETYGFAGASTQALDGLVRAAVKDPKVFAPKMLAYVTYKGAIISLAYGLGAAGLSEARKLRDQLLPDGTSTLLDKFFVADAMSKVPLDIKLGNTLLPVAGMVQTDENGKRSQGFIKLRDDRNPITTALNILMYKAADDMFGFDYGEEYANAWLRNLSPIDATRFAPIPAALMAAFNNVNPRNFKAIESQFSMRRPKDQIDQDTNRLAVQLANLWNTLPLPGEISPKGLERVPYALGLANNLGAGALGSLFASADLTPNKTMAKIVYDKFKPALKEFIYWSPADDNLTRIKDQAMQDYSVAELAIDEMAQDTIRDIKNGALTLRAGIDKISNSDKILPVDKDSIIKRIEMSYTGWNQYMKSTERLTQTEKNYIPPLDHFEAISRTKSMDAKAQFYLDRLPIEPKLRNIFNGIAVKYGLMSDRVQNRVQTGFKSSKHIGTAD